MAFVQMFRSRDKIWFAQSPSDKGSCRLPTQACIPDEQFGFSASAVNDGVKILHFGYLEGRHHVAHLQSSYEASLPALRCAMVAYL